MAVICQPMVKFFAVHKLESRWYEELLLCVNLWAHEVILAKADDGTFVKAWSLRRVPESERWDVDAVPRVRDGPAEFPPVEGPSPRLGAPIAFVVRHQDLLQFGFMAGCE